MRLRQIPQRKNSEPLDTLLILVNIGIVYLNYQENKKNVELTKENNVISKEIVENLKKINDDGIVGKACHFIEKERER
ncbi:MAG: hypothetical protein RRY22_04960 [Bacilli bacterium]